MKSNELGYTRITTNGANHEVRDKFVIDWMRNIHPGSILDIGAGNMPYKSQLENLGFEYTSHDFEKYCGNESAPGLQCKSWLNHGHDIVCDITELKPSNYDYVLLTEVLEHVEDPVYSMKIVSQTLKIGGTILISVPFSSRMHQAPFWFSSGLSPFWFRNHMPRFGLSIDQLTVAGDFVDVFIQEIPLLLEPLNRFYRLGNLAKRILVNRASWFRKRLSSEILESGGQSTFCVATRLT